MKKLSEMDIVAHRGGAGPHIENTLESFLYAIDIGFSAIEMDVRRAYFSKKFFLEHDYLHHPRYRRNYVTNILPKIPDKIKLFIELKTNSVLTNVYAKNFYRVYEKYLKKRDTFIISFNPIILFRLKDADPEMKTGYICGNRFFKFLFEKFICILLKPDLYVINRRFLNGKTVRFAKNRGMQIYSYVINRNEDRHKAMDLNLDGIITDYPL